MAAGFAAKRFNAIFKKGTPAAGEEAATHQRPWLLALHPTAQPLNGELTLSACGLQSEVLPVLGWLLDCYGNGGPCRTWCSWFPSPLM